jgi:hypothetical protein
MRSQVKLSRLKFTQYFLLNNAEFSSICRIYLNNISMQYFLQNFFEILLLIDMNHDGMEVDSRLISDIRGTVTLSNIASHVGIRIAN